MAQSQSSSIEGLPYSSPETESAPGEREEPQARRVGPIRRLRVWTTTDDRSKSEADQLECRLCSGPRGLNPDIVYKVFQVQYGDGGSLQKHIGAQLPEDEKPMYIRLIILEATNTVEQCATHFPNYGKRPESEICCGGYELGDYSGEVLEERLQCLRPGTVRMDVPGGIVTEFRRWETFYEDLQSCAGVMEELWPGTLADALERFRQQSLSILSTVLHRTESERLKSERMIMVYRLSENIVRGWVAGWEADLLKAASSRQAAM
ncbi:hypothetical protein OH76DRAFT_1421164 [Lentinus brumalis]|uniref:Uncharacterized protein n=1 Tax=Lentinus brumalis TaxID=2498619 RepID=A0A371CWY0_9APHY|nr:hypothetical protein OH76DRAFT_1421164 [Polyporus brumalis]